ncbi:hypothetical protein [Phenylobacterium ferrooxidans]|uniref:Uncharacterized protein n=1 Tax=Phenylobacterium ferrooxidans TaxID=2982689 RepID=A0ABW6CSM0_9CAUL
MKLSRRLFLQAIGLAAATPAFALPPRAPYVEAGDIVESLFFHQWDRPGAPIGPLVVHEVKPWDGRGYPVVIRTMRSWAGDQEDYYDIWRDDDWSNLRRDVPVDFWHHPGRRERYPNLHSYVRERRFGEHPSLMRQTMDRNRMSDVLDREGREGVHCDDAGVGCPSDGPGADYCEAVWIEAPASPSAEDSR